MSTTTEINPRVDTRLSEANNTTNYATDTKIKIGYASGSGKFDASILEFDLASYTTPADIVSAKLTISVLTEWGTTAAETINIARCTRDFDTTQATWDEYSTGNDWTTPGGDWAATEPINTSMTVGNTSGDQTAEIRELVIDAINRRESTLRLLLWMPENPGYTAIATYGSVDHATESKRPDLTITTAERVAWTNRDEDNDADNADNWSTGTVPDGGDYVLFNAGRESVTAGSILCHSLFVGRKYGGDIQAANGDPITLDASTTGTGHIIRVQNRRGIVNLYDQNARDMYIDTPSASTCKIKQTLVITPYNVTVARTGGDWQFTGDCNIVATSSQSKRLTLSGTASDVVAAQSTNVTLSNGCNDLTLIKSVATCTAGDIAGSVKIAAGAELTIQSEDNSGTIDVYNGTATLKNNENAGIDTGAVTVWPRGKFDARTGTGAWTPTADPAIISRGGRFELDQGVNLAPA